MENLSAIIEAILFVSGDPVRVDALAHAMNLTVSELNGALAELGDHLALENRGIQLNRSGETVFLDKFAVCPIAEGALRFRHVAFSRSRSTLPAHPRGGRAAGKRSHAGGSGISPVKSGQRAASRKCARSGTFAWSGTTFPKSRPNKIRALLQGSGAA